MHILSISSCQQYAYFCSFTFLLWPANDASKPYYVSMQTIYYPDLSSFVHEGMVGEGVGEVTQDRLTIYMKLHTLYILWDFTNVFYKPRKIKYKTN